jgi:carboxylate-amine ligase
MRDLALELLELIDDAVDELGSREEVEYIHTVLEEGTSADRQLAIYRQTGDLTAVVQHVVDETRASVGRRGSARKGRGSAGIAT